MDYLKNVIVLLIIVILFNFLAGKKFLECIKQGKHVYKMDFSDEIPKELSDDLKNSMKKNKPKKKKKKGKAAAKPKKKK